MARQKSNGELIVHVNAIRMRVVGSGNLLLKLQSLDNIRENDLLALPMQSTTNIQPTRLANFKQQRIALQGRTTEISEHFRISRIVIYTRTVDSSYPT